MPLQPWEIRDPAALIVELDRLHPFQPGRVVVGLIQHPATLQRLVASKIVWDDEALPTDDEELSPLLEHVAHELFGAVNPRDHHRGYTWITVVGRRGPVEWGPPGWPWFYGWQHAEHGLPTYVGEFVAVTEHGWRMLGPRPGAATPAARLPVGSDEANAS